MVSAVAGRAASQLGTAAGVWGTAATAVAGRRGAGQEPEAAHRLARQPARRTTVRVGDPADTVPHRARDAFPALPGRRVRHRLTPTNGAGHPTGASHAAHRCWTAQPCKGEAPPRPPAPEARRFNVADTARPTRSADQPSARIHDRPAVNGRAQSPSRLKPADPNGASTQPIDPGAWAPHSPLQGACGLSPGLQPRAFATDRPGSAGRGTTAPSGVDLPALRAGGSGSA